MQLPLALSFDDVLLVPQYSEVVSRQDVDLRTQISPRLKLKIPLIPTKMDTVTGVEMAIKISQLGGIAILPRFEPPAMQAAKVMEVVKAKQRVMAAVGVKAGELERAEVLMKAGAAAIVVDVAHGHMKATIDMTRALRQKYGADLTLISGITATYECARDLYKAGADSLLVGIGSSPICTTRIQTGFGLPSFTSLEETARAAKEAKKTFIPDSGIKNSGDIVKALAVGACAIVGGYIFAGTDECPGPIVEVGGKRYKNYNGSASEVEKVKQYSQYPQDKHGKYTIQIEGVHGLVEYKGPLEPFVAKLLAGVRSGLAYGGAKNIKELQRNAKFVRITPAAVVESNVHGVYTDVK